MQVNITKRIDTPEGNRYCPVVVGPDGRIKPAWVTAYSRQERQVTEKSHCILTP
jgi:hypothetical protein